MTITAQNTGTTGTGRVPMDKLRKTALVAGGLYLLTFIASIPTLGLKGPLRGDPGAFILGAGSATGVLLGGYLDLVTALAGVGTAVALFPVVKRQNESLALGFVAARILEAAVLFVGAVSLFSVVTLRQDMVGAAGADRAALVTTGQSLVAVHDWAFLTSPGLMPAVNALLLGSLMYRSGLVPRVIPLMGLIGAPLLVASATATIFGVFDQLSVWSGIATIPIFFWELSLGLWLVVKGFRPSPVTAGMVAGTPLGYRGVDA
jgi:hypothetical protein